MPTPNAHVDRLLTDQAIAYTRSGVSVARRALAVVPVERSSDLYLTWSRADFLRRSARVTGYGDAAPVWRPSASTTQYQALSRKLTGQIVRKARRDADDPAGYERGIVEGIMGNILLEEDLLFQSTCLTAASWASTNRLTGINSGTPTSVQFLSFPTAGSDPIAAVEQGRDIVRLQTGGLRANVLVVSADVDRVLRTHSTVRTIATAIVQGSGPIQGAARREQMAAIFDVEDYIVLDTSQVTSPENATVVMADVATGVMVLMYRPPASQAAMGAAAAKVFEVRGGTAVRRWADEPTDSDMIECGTEIDVRITSNVSGVHFASCLA